MCSAVNESHAFTVRSNGMLVDCEDDVARHNSRQLRKPTLNQRDNNDSRPVWSVTDGESRVVSWLLFEGDDSHGGLISHVLF